MDHTLTYALIGGGAILYIVFLIFFSKNQTLLIFAHPRLAFALPIALVILPFTVGMIFMAGDELPSFERILNQHGLVFGLFTAVTLFVLYRLLKGSERGAGEPYIVLTTTDQLLVSKALSDALTQRGNVHLATAGYITLQAALGKIISIEKVYNRHGHYLRVTFSGFSESEEQEVLALATHAIRETSRQKNRG